jgi:hypothetical protein
MTENRDVLRAMGERAREKVRAQFDWLRSAREAYACYCSVCPPAAPSASPLSCLIGHG